MNKKHVARRRFIPTLSIYLLVFYKKFIWTLAGGVAVSSTPTTPQVEASAQQASFRGIFILYFFLFSERMKGAHGSSLHPLKVANHR